MKKCKKCGTVQSNDRNICIECDSILGKPMTKNEEEISDAALDEKLNDMTERTDDFYVPLRDKIMGVLCILGIIASIILISLTVGERSEIKNEIPENITVLSEHGYTTVISDGVGNYQYPSQRTNKLSDVSMYSVIGIISLLFAFPMLLFPKFMWFIDTLKYRIFYEWDTHPSYFALFIRKAVTYIMFGIGIGSTLYGWYLYF